MDRRRKWQLENIKKNKCSICGKGKIFLGERCKSCYKKHGEKRRNYYWLHRKERLAYARRRKGELQMGYNRHHSGYHTVEEIKWAKKFIEDELDNNPTIRNVEESNMCRKFAKKFNRRVIGSGGMVNWAVKVVDPERHQKTYRGGKRSKNSKKVFEKSNFVAHMRNIGIFGFDTEDELKEFITSSQIIGSINLFKRVKARIDYKIDIK